MKCYYYPEKECKWGCYLKCDEGWDFVAGGSPCRIKPTWLKVVWAVLSIALLFLSIAMVF